MKKNLNYSNPSASTPKSYLLKLFRSTRTITAFTMLLFILLITNKSYGQTKPTDNCHYPCLNDPTISLTIDCNGKKIVIEYIDCSGSIKITSFYLSSPTNPTAANYSEAINCIKDALPNMREVVWEGDCMNWLTVSPGVELGGGKRKLGVFKLNYCNKETCCQMQRDDINDYPFPPASMDYGGATCSKDCFPACPY